MFYNGSVKAAAYGNFQYGENDNAGQIMVVGTWGSVASFEMSGSFGYTFAPDGYQPGSNLDFSLGFQKNIIDSAPWLLWIVDFSNYQYVFNSASMSEQRAIFITGLRVKFPLGSRAFANLDVAATDILDHTTRGIALGAFMGMTL